MSTQNTQQQKASANTQLQKVSENTMDSILAKVVKMEDNGLKLPPNYSAENAIRSAWLILQETQTMSKKPVLEACTKNSIANALLKMVLLGLNPVKRQGSFIAYGDKLEFQREYQGTIALAKRFGLKDVVANVIYAGDKFDFEIGIDGRKTITHHKQTLDSLSGEIKGAYAVTTMTDGSVDVEIMTIDDIHKSWNQGATKGGSKAHKNFPGEMCKKTVIGRALKTIINSSDDGNLYEGENENPKETPTESFVKDEIKGNANKKELSFDDAEEVSYEEAKEPDKEPEKKQEKAPDKKPEPKTNKPGF